MITWRAPTDATVNNNQFHAPSDFYSMCEGSFMERVQWVLRLSPWSCRNNLPADPHPSNQAIVTSDPVFTSSQLCNINELELALCSSFSSVQDAHSIAIVTKKGCYTFVYLGQRRRACRKQPADVTCCYHCSPLCGCGCDWWVPSLSVFQIVKLEKNGIGYHYILANLVSRVWQVVQSCTSHT